MKNPKALRPNKPAFSLVELLVVFTIVIVLAGLIFTMVTRMRKKADGAKAISNLRQIGPFLATYAVDNNGALPAPRADEPDGNGGFIQLHWHETVMTQAFTGVDPKFLRKKEWWKVNKPFMHNPLCNEKSKEWPFDWWNPGYAMNLRIARNLGLVKSEDWGPGKSGPQTNRVNLSRISDPGRTPIIAPRANWHYEFTEAQIKEEGLKQFLVDQKIPILFVDGHVETMTLKEYPARNLHLMPR